MGKPLSFLVGATVAIAVATTTVGAAHGQGSGSVVHEAPFITRVLPVAAMALVGGALGFFILPLALPAGAALTASTGTSPILGVVGASLGGFLGSRLSD